MKLTLQNKVFLIFSIVFVVPMLLTALVFNSLAKETLIGQIRDADLKTMETINNSIDNIITSKEQYGLLVANDPIIQEFLSNALDLASSDKSNYLDLNTYAVTEQYLNNSNSKYISLLSADGYLIGEKRLNRDRLNTILSKHLFNNLDKNQVNWQKMYTIEDVLTNDTYKVFPCIIPVNDYLTHESLGYVVVYLEERELYKTYSVYEDRVYILDDEHVITSHQDTNFLHKEHYQATNIGYSYVLKNQSTVIDGKIVLTTQVLNHFNWQMVMMTSFSDHPRDGLYSSTYFILTILFIVLFSVIMGIIIFKYISNPILKLTNTMKAVDNGNMSIRSKYKSKDEIGQMAYTFNSVLDTIQELMKKVLDEEKAKQAYRFQLIQAQVNPHFLYNALEMINSLIRLDLKEEALTSTFSISEFYRLSLSDGARVVSIKAELAIIRNFLVIQKMRYLEFIDYTIDIDPIINDYLIPKLTLQPIVENSIYHGLKERDSKGFLSIKGYMNYNNIVFEIEDNGKGMSEKKLDELSHSQDTDTNFGINCTKNRLQLYYGDDASFDIESKINEYTKTTIIIPCRLQSEEDNNV